MRVSSDSSVGKVDAAAPMEFRFDFEVKEDLSEDVDDVARESTIGHFGKAYEMSAERLDNYMEIFPIAFEVLRLLHDQGQNQKLREKIKYLKIPYGSSSSGQRSTFDTYPNQAKNIITLMDAVALRSMYSDNKVAIDKLPHITDIAGDFHNVRWENLDDDHVILAALLLRLKYLEHETRSPLPSETFILLDGKTPPMLVSASLQKKYFWAAEIALETCFRRTKSNHHRINLDEIWSAIEWFFNDMESEREIWAQIAILQTFCEGCLRRRMSHISLSPPGLNAWSWEIGVEILTKLISKIQVTFGKATWMSSRSFIRQGVLMLDRDVWQRVQRKDSSIEKQTLETLVDLKDRAHLNDDTRLLSGVQWRFEILANCKDPQKMSEPGALIAVPLNIYIRRYDLLQNEIPDKLTAMIAWCKQFGRSLVEQGHDQNGMIKLSGEFALPDMHEDSAHGCKRILLLGHVGTGKSTLLRTITRKWAATSNTTTTTSGIQQETCMWDNKTKLQVIDTPGFGDPGESDYTILHHICTFLKTEYNAARLLHGLFYLIDISKERVDEAAQRQADTFKQLVGDQIWRNVCFIYTHGEGKRSSDPQSSLKRKRQKFMAKEWENGVFQHAKSMGARFRHLGLDFGDWREIGDLMGSDSESSDDDDSETSETEVDLNSDTNMELDHNTQYHAHRPADSLQVDHIVSETLALTGPVVLQCQHEMGELSKPFEQTQVALSFEYHTRDDYDNARDVAARFAQMRRDTEMERDNLRAQAASLQESVKTQEAAQAESVARAAREIELQKDQELEEERKVKQQQLQQLESAREQEEEAIARRLKKQQRREEELQEKLRKLERELDASRKCEEAAEAASKKLKHDIEAIEALQGWTPRFVVHNKTLVSLHLRAIQTLILGLPTNFENDVEPGQFRAIHCGPGVAYRIEAFQSMPGNQFSRGGQVVSAMGTLGYLSMIAAASPFIPSLPAYIAASAAAGALWGWFQSKSNNDKTGSLRADEPFRSVILEGEERTVLISSSVPVNDIQPESRLQMFVMEATRKGERICLFQSVDLNLVKCTRLEIVGGPQSKGENGIMVYEYDAKTEPMRASRVDKFDVDIASSTAT